MVILVFHAAVLVIALERFPSAPSSLDYFYVPELGGWLSNGFQRPVQIGRTIRAETEELPPKNRILSTYASAIDTIAGSKNVTGVDYIIHALGEETRLRYRDRFRAAMPEYITTLRKDYTTWESWVQRTNWWFYREFINHYQLVDATFYNLIWKRLETPRALPAPRIQCAIHQEKNNVVNILLSDKTTSANDRVISGNQAASYYADLTLNYALVVKSSGVPMLGRRGLVNAVEIQTTDLKTSNVKEVFNYGLPPRHKNWHIPVAYRSGQQSKVQLVGYPQARASLNVSSCQAQLLASTDTFEIKRSSVAEKFVDTTWNNGISLKTETVANTPATSFRIDDPEILSMLVPGTSVEFSHSGVRRVVAFRDKEIWVEGDLLDPVQDGYPNPITFTLK